MLGLASEEADLVVSSSSEKMSRSSCEGLGGGT